MSNLPIKFLSVEINNFRGVPGKLVVPLDAPLTVIYAANGTGKSTICNALEWLLTGRVEDVKNSEYSCHWGEGDTSVSAKCLIDGVPHQLWRKGNSVWLAKGDARRAKVSEEYLLSLLTPETVTGKTTNSSNKYKRSWLRNSRWLYSNSLSLLIDNSKAEERQQIFADILGFGHLTSTLRNLRDYRKALPNTRGLVDNIARLDIEIVEAEKKLKESAPGRVKTGQSLELIFQRFPPKPAESNLTANLHEAQLRVGMYEQQVLRRVIGLDNISTQWDQYSSLRQQMESVQESIKSASAERLELSRRQQQNVEELSAANIKHGDGRRSVDWAVAKTAVVSKWVDIVKLPSLAEYFSKGEVFQAVLYSEFTELGWARGKQDAWRSGIAYLINDFESVLAYADEQHRLQENYVYPPVNLEWAVQEDKIAQEDFLRKQATFNALASTNERMISLGVEILAIKESKYCPLCTHEWPTPKTLHDAISAKAFMSPAIEQASEMLEVARDRVQKAAIALASARAQQFAYEEFTKKLNSVKEALASIEARTNFLAIMRRADYTTLDRGNLAFLRERIDAAIDLSEVFGVLPDLEHFFSLNAKLSVGQRIQAVIDAIGVYKGYYQKQMDESAPERIRLDQEGQGIAAAIQEKSAQIDSLSKSRQVMSATIERFNAQWAEFVGPGEVSIEHSNLAAITVDNDSRELERYKNLLMECEVVASIDAEAITLTKLHLEKENYLDKLALATRFLSDADRTIDQYSEHVKALTSSSLGLLLGPATELFSRMHANEVYKGLGVSEGTEYLHWTAFAEGHEVGLDAESKFSQGQRQDLALSLYLARARNTGGSFFLDEPIAHLDDLNRVAMLDIFRLVATSMPSMSIVLTTASESLARHMAQKFSGITDLHVLNMVHLEGNPRTGVEMKVASNMDRQLPA